MDDADIASEQEAAAMARFEAQRREAQRIEESRRGYDPSLPVHCLDCGVDIPAARLRAYPHTRRCVHCASEVERGYRERWTA